MGTLRFAIVLLAALLAGPALAETPSPEELGKVAETLDASAVVVQYHLRFDRGDAPRMLSWSRGEESLVQQERPLERAGLLVGDGLVVTTDPMIHPRFVQRIEVRRGDRVAPAAPFAWLERGDGVMLKTDGDVGGTPLSFDVKADPAYRGRVHYRDEAWGISAWRHSTILAREGGRSFALADTPLDVTLSADGRAIGIQFFDELPLDGSWKGSPLGLPAIPADRMAAVLQEIEAHTSRGVPRVTLSFRSAKAKGGQGRFSFFHGDDDEEDATEIHAAGVVLDERTVLVLADLKPKVTARLERILVHLPEGEPVAAEFRASLKRLGAFVVATRSPLPGPLPVAPRDIRDWRGRAIVAAEIAVHGEERTSHVYPARFDSLRKEFRGSLHPTLRGQEENLFLVDPSGALLAFPAVRRDVFATQERWARSESPSLFAAIRLKDALSDVDPANVPLSEEEENRLAWMGVVLQPLDEELARANKVLELAKGGEVGGLVAYVYPESPAARAGVAAGDILLRLHAEGLPKPLDIKADENPFAELGLPAEIPEEMQEMFGGEMPPPWPSAESALARMLTDLGAGRSYDAELVHEGKLVRMPFVVEFGPTHYDSARRHKSDALGLTVRDLTYEVRRHFQLQPDDPGVVVSKVEKGKKAAVAGVRTFDIVTQVDDKPVASADEFAKAMAGSGERRLTLRRQSRTQVVKIVVGGE